MNERDAQLATAGTEDQPLFIVMAGKIDTVGHAFPNSIMLQQTFVSEASAEEAALHAIPELRDFASPEGFIEEGFYMDGETLFFYVTHVTDSNSEAEAFVVAIHEELAEILAEEDFCSEE